MLCSLLVLYMYICSMIIIIILCKPTWYCCFQETIPIYYSPNLTWLCRWVALVIVSGTRSASLLTLLKGQWYSEWDVPHAIPLNLWVTCNVMEYLTHKSASFLSCKKLICIYWYSLSSDFYSLNCLLFSMTLSQVCWHYSMEILNVVEPIGACALVMVVIYPDAGT